MGDRKALLVATSKYADPKLAQLRSPIQDAQALRDVLRNPDIGDFRVDLAHDEPQSELRIRLVRFFEAGRADDLLLLHIGCHGIKDDDGRLYFAATDTEVSIPDATAIDAELVKRRMDQSQCQRVVLMLDCCYSGAFGSDLLHRAGTESVDLMERFEGVGRAVLTASNSLEYAWEGEELRGNEVGSVFTTLLVEALQTGDADSNGDGWISFDELHAHIARESQRRKHKQTPLKWTFGIDGELQLARSIQGPRPTVGGRGVPIVGITREQDDWGPVLTLDLRDLRLGPDTAMIDYLQDMAETGQLGTREADTAVFGKLLWQQVESTDLETALDDALTEGSRSRQTVSLQLVYDRSSKPAALAWEYMYRPDSSGDGTFLATDSRLAMSRHWPTGEPRSPQQALRLELLIVTAVNLDGDALRSPAADATHRLLDTVTRLPWADVSVLRGASVYALETMLESSHPDVIHLMTMGRERNGRMEVAFCTDDTDDLDWHEASVLHELLAGREARPRLVVLDAVEASEMPVLLYIARGLEPMAVGLVEAGVQTVVAFQRPLPRHSATHFARKLYSNLLNGLPTDEAVQLARQNLQASAPSQGRDAFAAPSLFQCTPGPLVIAPELAARTSPVRDEHRRLMPRRWSDV